MDDIRLYLRDKKKLIDKKLLELLPIPYEHPKSIHEAMHYSLFSGGKRLRPILTLACAESLGYDILKALPCACAIELIHTYSLIHDDLPAMDNDDMRRGKPSSHKIFGEAIAILAGDALLTYAFSIPSNTNFCKMTEPQILLRIIYELSAASGVYGMIAGQVLDIESIGKDINNGDLLNINNLKTAYLFKAAIRIGSILAMVDEDKLRQLTEYGYFFGLAFQIVDDIIDIEQETKLDNKKPTYASLIGAIDAKKTAEDFIDKAIFAIESFDHKADVLRQLAQFIIMRLN